MARPRGLNLGPAIGGYGRASELTARSGEILARGLRQLGAGIGGGIQNRRARETRAKERQEDFDFRTSEREARQSFQAKTTLATLQGQRLEAARGELDAAEQQAEFEAQALGEARPATLQQIQSLRSRVSQGEQEQMATMQSLMNPAAKPKGGT